MRSTRSTSDHAELRFLGAQALDFLLAEAEAAGKCDQCWNSYTRSQQVKDRKVDNRKALSPLFSAITKSLLQTQNASSFFLYMHVFASLQGTEV